MSDTSTPGDRLDAILADVQQAADDLRTKVDAERDEVAADVAAGIDTLFTALDELQAAWTNRAG